MTSLALGLKLSAIKTLSAVQRAINILKSAGPGAWYDPSDLTTLFQDSAGITPVTAVEQPVGLVLDKSKGLVLGPELVTNGTFDTAATGWSPVLGGTITHSAGSAVFGSSGVSDRTAEQVITTKVGSAYRVSVNVSAISAGAQGIMAGTVSGGTDLLLAPSAALGSRSATFTATTTTTYIGWICGDANRTATVDNISVRELPGAHLIQPTATSRPTLSSRYNLLTKTEQFDDAAWQKYQCSVTPNATTAPDGTNTADKIFASPVTDAHSAYQAVATVAGEHVFSVSAKAAEYQWLAVSLNNSTFVYFNLSTGVVGTVGAGHSGASMAPVGGGFYRCSVSAAFSAGTSFAFVNPALGDGGYVFLGDGTSGIYIWGASLTTTSDASLPHQRVNTATDYDYDFSKFPPYLRFDGVDDSMYTAASVDFTSTDKMTVFAGVHKANDTLYQTILETGVGSSNGSIGWRANNGTGGTYALLSQGTLMSQATTAASYVGPTTSVLTGISDISTDNATVRVNGVQVQYVATDQGTGNYANLVLNVGRRNNASLPFNGRIYQLALKGKAMTAAEISTLESYVNSKTKAF